MMRSLRASLVGLGLGFGVGYAGVSVIAASHPATDSEVVALLVGTILAGTGAVTGAVIGGVSELRKHLGRPQS